MAEFSFSGKKIYYETYGEGKPLFILNGIMMSCLSWKSLIPALSESNQLILVDFLDQGRSGKMDEPYTQELQVEVVRALLDHLKLSAATLAGISYGGEIAIQFALKYPERLTRLILFNTTARTGPWLGDIGDGWNKAAGDAEAYYLATIPVIYSPAFYTINNDWINRRKKELLPIFSDPAFYEAMVRLTNSAKAYDVSEELNRISTPTLVVSGDLDYLTPVEEQRFICSRIPGAQHIILPGCGHASMYEKPVLFSSIVYGFTNQSLI